MAEADTVDTDSESAGAYLAGLGPADTGSSSAEIDSLETDPFGIGLAGTGISELDPLNTLKDVLKPFVYTHRRVILVERLAKDFVLNTCKRC